MPTTAARTLDVTATGEAGIDLDNTVGTLAKTTDITGFNDLSAAQVNAEVDSALDTAIPVTPTTGSINDKVKPLTFSTANQVDARVQSWLGVAPNALISGRVDASVGAMAANVVTAAAVATGAIDADALAADAATEIRSFANGTSDSGTTTTMVDAARTEADIDYWKGSWIAFTSGTLLGQVRLITAFDPVTDTITFAPATTVAVGTHTYEILPSARVDLQLWLGAVVNALIAGRVDANAQVVGDKTGYAIGVGGIGATAFAAGAIDAAAIAADAIGASEIANGAIDAATFAAGAIDAAAIATDAIGSAEFSQAAADKVFGGSGATLAELAQAAPPITPRPDQVLMLLYMALRNASKSTATERRILNDAGTIISKATMSDDGTTFDQGKLISGL